MAAQKQMQCGEGGGRKTRRFGLVVCSLPRVMVVMQEPVIEISNMKCGHSSVIPHDYDSITSTHDSIDSRTSTVIHIQLRLLNGWTI